MYDIKEEVMSEICLKEDKQIKLAIALKTNQLKRERLSSLTYQHVEDTLFNFVWKFHPPKSVHEAINDIVSLDANEIIAFLSNQAIILGAQMKLHEFDDLLGGNKK